MAEGNVDKTIVVCCDGTWNKPKDETSVWRSYKLLAKALDQAAPETDLGDRRITEGSAGGRHYVLYYDGGVGTAERQRLKGGTFAVDLSANIKQAYEFLLERWQQGDRVFCLDLAVESGLPIFRERSEVRRLTPPGTTGRIDGQDVEIEDLSPSGARLGKVRRLEVGIDYPFHSNDVGATTASVVWTRRDRAGIRLLQ
jgi:hypothetical protein